MAFTKAQLEGLKNTLIASNQPILANQHREQIQSIIDEMFDSQTRANVLVGVQADSNQGGSDTFLIFRSGEAYQIPLSLLSATTLASLGDVLIASLTDGDTLVYNSVEDRWENQNIFLGFSIANLEDVNLSSLTNGDILRYNSSTDEWDNVSLSNILAPFALLTDLDDFQLLSEKGQANGYAQLDSGAKIPISIIPVGSVAGTVAEGNDSRFHAAATLGTANGLSLAGQVLSLGLSSANSTGALSDADFNAFSAKVGGSGTTNFLSKFTGAGTIGNSAVFENGGNVGIGTTTPSERLQVNGNINLFSGSANSFIGSTTFHKTLYLGANIRYLGSDDPFTASNNQYISSVGESNTGAVQVILRANSTTDRGFFVQLAPDSTGAGDTVTELVRRFGITQSSAYFLNTNVGIGTTTPTNTLDINGTARVRTINNGTGDFITSDANGVLTKRTAAQTLTDIGAQAAGNFVTIDTTQTITGSKTFSLNSSFNGVTIGRGGGNLNTNTAVGFLAGQNNTTGDENSFFGQSSGQNNTTGGSNSFFGRIAGFNNTTGASNSFFGRGAGANNTTGGSNSFFGRIAGVNNTEGAQNSFFGQGSGQNNTTGAQNSFFGKNAGRFISGGGNLTIANNSVFLGFDTRALANNQTNQIVIGHNAIGIGENSVVLGNASIATTVLRGNVGIGTTNPLSKLEVIGNACIGFTADAAVAAPTNGLIVNGIVGIGINNPATSAILDLTSTTRALVITRMTTTQRNALTAAINGMILYNTTLNKFQGYENGAWANLI